MNIRPHQTTAGFRYACRQIKMQIALKLFHWAITFTPSDIPEFAVLAKAVLDMPEACRTHEIFEQFRASRG